MPKMGKANTAEKLCKSVDKPYKSALSKNLFNKKSILFDYLRGLNSLKNY